MQVQVFWPALLLTVAVRIGGGMTSFKGQSIARTSSPDLSPDTIGGLFRQAHATHIESVRFLIECGQLLKAKKDSLNFREWLPWLEENREALGFGERTAQLLMKAADSNPQLTSDLTPADVLRINRGIWGNSPEKRAAPLSRQADAESNPSQTSADIPNAAHTGGSTTPDAGPEQIPVEGEKEAELPPEAHDLWEPDADEEALIEREQKEFRESIGNVMGANGEPVNAVDEIKRLTDWIAKLTHSRDWWMQEKSSVTADLKEEIRKVRSLGRKLDNANAEVKRLTRDNERLNDENEALRERIAIMSQGAA